jgi:hypothetical protein
MEFFCKFYLKSEFENSSRTLAQFFCFSLVFPKIHPKFFGLIPFAKETNFGSTLYKMAQPTKST